MMLPAIHSIASVVPEVSMPVVSLMHWVLRRYCCILLQVYCQPTVWGLRKYVRCVKSSLNSLLMRLRLQQRSLKLWLSLRVMKCWRKGWITNRSRW